VSPPGRIFAAEGALTVLREADSNSQSMGNVNAVFLLSIVVIALGYFIKTIKVVTEKEGRALTSLILNVTLPALALNTISTITIEPALALLPFICIAFSAGVLYASFLFFRKEVDARKGLLCMSAIGFNIGLFAYPLIEGIWGVEGLKHVALFDVGNAFVIFGIAYTTGTVYSPKTAAQQQTVNGRFIARKLLTSAPLMSYVIALVLNFTHFQLPGFATQILTVLARANMALVLLVLGIYLNFDFKRSQWFDVAKILLIRYGFGLALGLILYLVLPFSRLYRSIVLISLILPLGMTIIPFAVLFHYDEKLAGTTANLSILISFGLMWTLILSLGLG
jgi:malate permease and related proteins